VHTHQFTQLLFSLFAGQKSMAQKSCTPSMNSMFIAMMLGLDGCSSSYCGFCSALTVVGPEVARYYIGSWASLQSAFMSSLMGSISINSTSRVESRGVG